MPAVARPGVRISIKNGGLGRRTPSDDNISALIFMGYTGPTSPITFGTAPRRGFTLTDFEDLGITSAWQTSSTQLTHYQIDEFFRVNPSGELWVMFVPGGDLRTIAELLQELQTVAEGTVKRVGFVNSYASTTLIGSLVTALPVQEDRGTGLYAMVEQNTLATLADNRSRISKVVLQDTGYLRVITGVAAPTALPAWVLNSTAMGTVLGRRAFLDVASDLLRRDFDEANLQTDSRFITPGFSDATLLSSKTDAALDLIEGDRVIYATKVAGLPGLYLSNGHTLATLTSDFAYSNNVETILKARRVVLAAMNPLVGSKFRLNNGVMDQLDVDRLETAAREPLGFMKADGEISNYDVELQQSATTVDSFSLVITIVPIGTARVITITMGFTRSV